MIRTDTEHRQALVRLTADRTFLEKQQAALQEMGLDTTQVERAMAPARAFVEQLEEEVETYERMCRGEFQPLYDLTNIGRWLIGLRIAQGMNQRELAEKLGVAESVVSRDERNEYYGVSVEKAQRILTVLEAKIRVELDEPLLPPDSEHVA